MTRKYDWQSALSAFLIEQDHRIFEYGKWDCCLFACDAVAVMTGVDVAADYRGGYTTRRQALQAIRARTGKRTVLAVAESVTAAFDMPTIRIALAQRGDVALLKRGRDYSLGIVDLTGERIAVAAAEGLLRVPMQTAMTAWRG